MENEMTSLTFEEMRQKAYWGFFGAGENLINVVLAQMPENQRMGIMGAVAVGHSEIEFFVRYSQTDGAMTCDAHISLRTGEQVVELARITGRPGKPPAITVN